MHSFNQHISIKYCKLNHFLLFTFLFHLLTSCFNTDEWDVISFKPLLLEPLINQTFRAEETCFIFRWKLSEEGSKCFTYNLVTLTLDGKVLGNILPNQNSLSKTFDRPLADGKHQWAVILKTEEGQIFSSQSQFFIQNPPYIKNNSLDNLQAYIDDYLIVAIEFNEPVSGLELNSSLTIESEIFGKAPTLSDLETDDQTLFYFKVRDFEWGHPYRLSFHPAIHDAAQNPMKETSFSFRSPQSLPQPKAVGWIGGGKDGWQTENGPFQSGSGDREFLHINSISLSPDGSMIYVAEETGDRVQRWTSDGIYQGWIGWGKDGWQTGITPSTDWASLNQRYFNQPQSVYLDKLGNIFVVCQLTNTIHKLDLDGNAIGWLGNNKVGWQTESFIIPEMLTCSYEAYCPSFGIQTDDEGNIYTLEFRHTCSKMMVLKLSPQGELLGYLGCGRDGWQTEFDAGKCPLQSDYTDMRYFLTPEDLALDRQGNIYITDPWNQWVIKWSKEGKAIGWIGHGKDGWQTGDVTTDTHGVSQDLRSFGYPADLTIDNVGNLYIAEWNNHRVSKWTKDGKAVGWFGNNQDGWQTADAPVWDGTIVVAEFGKDFRGYMETRRIPNPVGIDVDKQGTIYVSNSSGPSVNWRVSKWVMGDGEGGGGTPVEE